MKGAGGGRPRKPKNQRRHRNKPTKDTIRVQPAARVSKVPEPALKLNQAQQRLWSRMWDQPIATLWDEGDVAALSRLVVLQTTRAAITDPKTLTEIRQLEDRFLMNPYSRAQQRVVIVGQDPDGDEEGDADVSQLDEYRRRAQQPS